MLQLSVALGLLALGQGGQGQAWVASSMIGQKNDDDHRRHRQILAERIRGAFAETERSLATIAVTTRTIGANKPGNLVEEMTVTAGGREWVLDMWHGNVGKDRDIQHSVTIVENGNYHAFWHNQRTFESRAYANGPNPPERLGYWVFAVAAGLWPVEGPVSCPDFRGATTALSRAMREEAYGLEEEVDPETGETLVVLVRPGVERTALVPSRGFAVRYRRWWDAGEGLELLMTVSRWRAVPGLGVELPLLVTTVGVLEGQDRGIQPSGSETEVLALAVNAPVAIGALARERAAPGLYQYFRDCDRGCQVNPGGHDHLDGIVTAAREWLLRYQQPARLAALAAIWPVALALALVLVLLSIVARCWSRGRISARKELGK